MAGVSGDHRSRGAARGWRLGAVAIALLAALALVSSEEARRVAASWTAPSVAQAQTSSYAEFVARANANTVTIVAGAPGDTSLYLAQDLATVLHCVNGLRVIPIVGRSDAHNIHDLLFLKGADLTIVRADVLEELAANKRYTRDLRGRIVYIAPLFNQEVHLIVSDAITSVADLEGKFVNIGAPGSLALAARKVLSAAGVTAIESKFDTALALERLVDGRLDAVFITGGKPIPALAQLGDVSGLKLLALTPPEGASVYETAMLKHQDYPNLVRAGDEVRTIAVPSVLAGYNWPADHPRFAKTKLFTETLFSRLDYLRRPARHPKWGDAGLTGSVEGWRRFAPASELVAESRARAAPAAPVVQAAAPAAPTRSEDEIDALFRAQLAQYGIVPRNDEERQLLFEAFKRRLEATGQ